ncbi:3-deoxy-manno-octulosonate cytidylyltransferase [Sulfurovum sp. enrichment culture clone C5]|uniref:3-deoxy-manno-octulosonate cytidylyltransferase n=1 Tax=Sulfurovum sp. enrichment culture clone C5 TaxID=497650 RepID=A0A0S4XQ88_9BACT|nr:3-deoxy-manno-octulosonate cytidylyltransferase [Sulfurovum sp. enrichment culture clone C5]
MIIIPARIGSTRFPNKILADIDGVPMVIRTAKAIENIDDILIATDSDEVINIAKHFGYKAILTDTNHQSGTDRIFEAAKKFGLSGNDIVINVQADEPFIEESVVKAVYELTKKNISNEKIIMNSCYKILNSSQADDPNLVKVVISKNSNALYFSRSKIPYPRDHHFDEFKGHIGIYGFSMKSLEIFCSLKTSLIEHIEKLEQLRALDNDYSISMIEVETNSFGIDTQEDLDRALKFHIL